MLTVISGVSNLYLHWLVFSLCFIGCVKKYLSDVFVGLGLKNKFAIFAGLSEVERLKRENELLQRQVHDMHAKMAAVQRKGH